MVLFAAAPKRDHEIGLFQYGQVLRRGLTAYVQVRAESPERLPVLGVKLVEQQSTSGIGERFEDLVDVRFHELIIMQPIGCMSMA